MARLKCRRASPLAVAVVLIVSLCALTVSANALKGSISDDALAVCADSGSIFSVSRLVPGKSSARWGNAEWLLSAYGVDASVGLLCPSTVETGVEYPLNVTLEILAVHSDSPFYADYVSVVHLAEAYTSPWGGSSGGTRGWVGNWSVGTQFVADEGLAMPDSLIGLFPGQSLQILLHISAEMTVVDTQGSSHPSHTDFSYGILVVAGEDAATYHGELQAPYFLGATILLVVVLILAFTIYEKRK